MSQLKIALPIGDAEIKFHAHVVAKALLAQFMNEELEPVATKSNVPRIGEYWHGQGGVLSGLMRGIDGMQDYYLITAVVDAVKRELAFGSRGVDEPGAQSEWDGASNTKVLIESKNDHPIAYLTARLEVEGHRDYYVAARREARILQANTPELFDKDKWHWTSTQYSPDFAWLQHFDDGTQDISGKNDERPVLVVRRVFINSII